MATDQTVRAGDRYMYGTFAAMLDVSGQIGGRGSVSIGEHARYFRADETTRHGPAEYSAWRAVFDMIFEDRMIVILGDEAMRMVPELERALNLDVAKLFPFFVIAVFRHPPQAEWPLAV